MNDIVVKALNPDDDTEVSQVLRLFRSSFGKSYPLTLVERPAFWKSQASKRFLSLLAVQNHNVIAHLALYRSALCLEQLEVCFLVNDAAIDSAVKIEVSAALSETTLRYAKRLGCRWLSHHAFAVNLPGQVPGNEILTGSEVALFPGALPHCPYVIAYRKLVLPDPHTRPSYVPEWHRAICALTYSSLGLSRTLLSGSAPARAVDTQQCKHRCHSRFSRKRQSRFTFVEPGLFKNASAAWQEIKTLVAPLHFVAVKTGHPRAPALCGLLEENHYRFCGLLPGQAEAIVYFSFPRNKQNLSMHLAAQDSILAHYIDNYDPTLRANLDKYVAGGSVRPIVKTKEIPGITAVREGQRQF